MSIDDPVVAVWSQKYGHILMRGRETFYDEEGYLRSWETAEAAAEWAMANLGASPYEHLPDREQEISERRQEEWRTEPRQHKLI